MEKSSLSVIQEKIADALEHLKDKAKFTEAILSKSVRISGKIDGKNKAGVSLCDLEKALDYVESNGIAFFEVHLNSENEFMFFKSERLEHSEQSNRLDQDSKHRRNSAEKAMILFSNSDVNEKTDSKKIKNLKKQKKIRTKSEKINIYSNFEDLD